MNGIQITSLGQEIEQILKKNGIDGDMIRVAIEIAWHADRRFYELVKNVLSYDDFKEICRKYNSEGGHTMAELAKQYNVSIATINRIVKNEYW